MWVSTDPPRPAPPLEFYLHLRVLVSPASLRRRPVAEREPEPLPPPPPPAGGKRGEGDEHPGADSAAPRRHRKSPARRRGVAARRGRLARFPPSAAGREGGTALRPGGGGCPSASHTGTARFSAASYTHPAHTEGGGTGTRPWSPPRGGCAQPINPAAPGLPAAGPGLPSRRRRLCPARREQPLRAARRRAEAGRPLAGRRFPPHLASSSPSPPAAGGAVGTCRFAAVKPVGPRRRGKVSTTSAGTRRGGCGSGEGRCPESSARPSAFRSPYCRLGPSPGCLGLERRRRRRQAGKPPAPPARRGWYGPAPSPARQRRGSRQFHCFARGGSRGFPPCVTGSSRAGPRRAAVPAAEQPPHSGLPRRRAFGHA